MRMDKLTSKFQLVIADAQSLAIGRDHQFIEPLHLMAAMLNQEGGSIGLLLNQSDINLNILRSRVSQKLDQMPQVEGSDGDIHISNDMGRILNRCDKLAQKRKDKFIASELFVLAAIEDKGVLGEILRDLGANEAVVSEAINAVRGGENINDANAEEQRQALEKYTVDLTERAEQGKLDPVIGRDEEIRRTIQVLQRRTKNNPVLIGEPGVGKTAIIEGACAKNY